MNKSEFINRLEKALGNMKWEEKKEVIYDYEEYFANAVSEGKAEEQAAEELGNPEEIALNYFQESGAKSESAGSSSSSFSSVVNNIVKSALSFASQSLNEAFNLEKVEISSESIADVANAQKLEIHKCRGVDVKIVKASDARFAGSLKGMANTNPERVPILTHSYDPGQQIITFLIDWKGQKAAGITGELIINVPESFCGEIEVETVSGNLLQVPENIRGLSYKSVSGEIAVESLSVAEEVSVKTVSGDLKSDKLNCQKIVFKSVSGDLKGDGVSTESLKFDSTSGTLKLALINRPEHIKFNTVSGNGVLNLPSGSAVDLSFKSISGRMKSEIPFVVESEKKGFGTFKFKGACAGEGSIKIDAKTVSGSIKIDREGEAK